MSLPFVSEKTPTELYLSRVFVKSYAAKWREIGLALGFITGELNIIEIDHRGNVEGQCMTMLKRWLERDVNATWEKLFKAANDDPFPSISG